MQGVERKGKCTTILLYNKQEKNIIKYSINKSWLVVGIMLRGTAHDSARKRPLEELDKDAIL